MGSREAPTQDTDLEAALGFRLEPRSVRSWAGVCRQQGWGQSGRPQEEIIIRLRNATDRLSLSMVSNSQYVFLKKPNLSFQKDTSLF